MDRILESVLYLLKEKTRIGKNCVVSDKVWLRKTKKSRFVFLLWEKKIQNNEIKTPTLEDTIFKKKEEDCWKVGMRKCSKQLPKKSWGNDHLVIKSGNKVFLVLLNGLINPWKSAAGHIIRMWRQPRYQRLCIAPSKYLHLIYKLTLETSVLIFNCVNVKYTRFHIAESQTSSKK